MPVSEMPVADAGLATTLAHTIKLDRNLSRVHDLSDAELDELNRNLLTHLVRWINGKERDVRACSTSLGSFCTSHAVPQLESAFYLQLVREGVADFLGRQDVGDSEEVRASANRFFDRLVCEVLRA